MNLLMKFINKLVNYKSTTDALTEEILEQRVRIGMGAEREIAFKIVK